MSKSAFITPVVCLVLAACRQSPPATPVSPSASPPVTPAAVGLTLYERLASELAARPAAAQPRAETVLAALENRGLQVQRWKQVLASPVGARFCMAGQTDLGVGVAVCEYDRPEHALSGRERSRALFDRLIPDRELLVRGTTLLTLTRPASAGPPDDQARRLAQAFAAL